MPTWMGEAGLAAARSDGGGSDGLRLGLAVAGFVAGDFAAEDLDVVDLDVVDLGVTDLGMIRVRAGFLLRR
jgi:hypothetical protein